MKDRKELLEQIKGIVDSEGFAVLFIGADVENVVPAFCYTVGNAKQGFPDVFMWCAFGMDVANPMVNRLVANWEKTGFKLGINEEIAQFEDDRPMSGEVVAVDFDYLTQNHALLLDDFYDEYPEYKGETDVPAVQLFWPDEKGKFPSQEGFNTGLLQPKLPAAASH